HDLMLDGDFEHVEGGLLSTRLGCPPHLKNAEENACDQGGETYKLENHLELRQHRTSQACTRGHRIRLRRLGAAP
ncbi:MAG: hypothetical protein WDA71_11505, partial [Actinomycetota bacterium]